MRISGFFFVALMLVSFCGVARSQNLMLNPSFETPDGSEPAHWEPDFYSFDSGYTDYSYMTSGDARDGNAYIRLSVAVRGASRYLGYSPSESNYQLQPGCRYRVTYSHRRSSERFWKCLCLYSFYSKTTNGGTVEQGGIIELDCYPPHYGEEYGVWIDDSLEFETGQLGDWEDCSNILAFSGNGYGEQVGDTVDYDNIQLELLEVLPTWTPENTLTSTPTSTFTPTSTNTPTITPTPKRYLHSDWVKTGYSVISGPGTSTDLRSFEVKDARFAIAENAAYYMGYDQYNNELIASEYGNPSRLLHRFDASTGDFRGISSVESWSGGEVGSLFGLGIVVAQSGEIYLSDYLAESPEDTALWKMNDYQSASVTNAMSGAPFCRNMDIVGTGQNTYIAASGTNEGTISILKSQNEECTSFAEWKTIDGNNLVPVGAGRDGVALSPVNDTEPPKWVIGAGAILPNGLRLFKYDGEDYTLSNEMVDYRAVDVAIDIGDDTRGGMLFVVRTLENTSGYGSPSMDVFSFNRYTGAIELLETIDLSEAPYNIPQFYLHASIQVNTADRTVYVGFNNDQYLSLAGFSYDSPPAPVSNVDDHAWQAYE